MASNNENAVESMTRLFERMNAELPTSTKKSLLDIQKLDQEVQKLLRDLHQRKIVYMANYEKMSTDQRAKAFELVRSELLKVLKMTDQKIDIARGMKTNVEDLSTLFSNEEQKFAEHIHLIEQVAERKAEEKRKLEEAKKEENGEEGEEKERSKKRGRKRKDEKTIEKKEEKLYCLCQIFKEDTMIMCDGPKCQAEWFHFGCVGLSDQPEGLWFCGPACEKDADVYGPRPQSDDEDSQTEDEKERKTVEQKKGLKRKR